MTGISFGDVKILEDRVRKLTGDPTAKLVRNFEEYQGVRGIKPKVAKFEADRDKATLTCYDWIDESLRAKQKQ